MQTANTGIDKPIFKSIRGNYLIRQPIGTLLPEKRKVQENMRRTGLSWRGLCTGKRTLQVLDRKGEKSNHLAEINPVPDISIKGKKYHRYLLLFYFICTFKRLLVTNNLIYYSLFAIKIKFGLLLLLHHATTPRRYQPVQWTPITIS